MSRTCAPMLSDAPMTATARVIFGCGSQALYVIENLVAAGKPSPDACVDLEEGKMVGRKVLDVPILGRSDALERYNRIGAEAIIAHGNNRLKLALAAELAELGFAFFNALHPAAVISPFAAMGKGCIINAGATILPQARLGDHVVVHSGVVVEHDCVLNDAVNLAPGVALAGRVEIGRGSYIYTGASVRPTTRIGAFATVGAGAVVIAEVLEGQVVVGVPARPMREPENQK